GPPRGFGDAAAAPCAPPPVGGDPGLGCLGSARGDRLPDPDPARDRGPPDTGGERSPDCRAHPRREARPGGGGRPPVPRRAARSGGRRGAGLPARRGGSGVSAVPEDVQRLAAEREEARARRDFAAADALRDRILDAGYTVTDTPEGPRLDPAAP